MTAGDLRDQFVAGFRERLLAMRGPGKQLLEGPGFLGLLGTAEAPDGRVLVTDDRALDLLSGLLPGAGSGASSGRPPGLHALVVNVFAAAEACHALLARTPGYRRDATTAMVCADLAAVPDPPLPAALALRRAGGPGESGVPLEAAAAAALRSDPSSSPVDGLAGFLRYLRSVPHAHFLAATDPDGRVRATAASATFGRSTAVFFVNTDSAWRGRGVGTAMTAAALHAAADAGARSAVLDASALGHSIYRRLGFTAVAANSLFVRTS